jgi:hypothetical protein
MTVSTTFVFFIRFSTQVPAVDVQHDSLLHGRCTLAVYNKVIARIQVVNMYYGLTPTIKIAASPKSSTGSSTSHCFFTNILSSPFLIPLTSPSSQSDKNNAFLKKKEPKWNGATLSVSSIPY